MAKKTETAAKKKPIEHYDYKGKKRPNKGPVRLSGLKRATGARQEHLRL